MNTPNPLVPQGTLPDKGKAQIRITVFAILAIHVVLLGVLLIAGCNKKTNDQAQTDTGIPPIPPPPTDPGWPAPPTSAPVAQVTQDLVHVTPPPAPVTPVEVVPPPPPQPDPIATGLSEHTIAKGESFYTLGKKYHVGFKAIAEANPGINPNRLKVGDKVKIPAGKAGGAAPAGIAPAAAAGGAEAGKTYKVKSGDNLMKIAKNQGVSLKQLRAANNLRTDQIKVGQTLKIPAKASAPAAVEAVPPVPAAPAPVAVPPPGFPPSGTPQPQQ